jgi:hypothetical protein
MANGRREKEDRSFELLRFYKRNFFLKVEVTIANSVCELKYG